MSTCWSKVYIGSFLILIFISSKQQQHDVSLCRLHSRETSSLSDHCPSFSLYCAKSSQEIEKSPSARKEWPEAGAMLLCQGRLPPHGTRVMATIYSSLQAIALKCLLSPTHLFGDSIIWSSMHFVITKYYCIKSGSQAGNEPLNL